MAMLLRVVNKLSRILGRLPDIDDHETRISALEFGVAGGNGLLALERAAMRLAEIFGVEIDVYGFDSG
ncbi:MAG: hypothetical protein ACYSUA_16250, partial [Planctomycetota bacterium]